VLYILKLKVNLLSVSALEVDGFGVAFYCGRVLLYPEGETLTQQCCLVSSMRGCTGCWDNLLGSSGFLDSYSVSESRQVACERELISGTHSSSGTLRGSVGMSRCRWMLRRE
jgi:hypothetical protein